MRPNSKEVYKRLMILKYVISHSYRNIPFEIINEMSENWSDSDKEKLENELKKNMLDTVSSIKEFGLWNDVTESEKKFLSSYGNNSNLISHMNSNWRMESAVILMWALKIENKYPDINKQTDTEILKKIEIKKLGLFFNDLSLISSKEINHKRDIMEVWHWRVNTRRLIEDNYNFVPDEKMKKAGINCLDDIVKQAAKSAYMNHDINEIIDDDFVFKGQPFRDLSEDDFHEATSIIIERHHALNWLCGYAPNNNWDETPTNT